MNENQNLDKNQSRGGIVNLQGTAKMMTKMTAYGRTQANKHINAHTTTPHRIKIINVADSSEVTRQLESNKESICDILRRTPRIQPLPKNICSRDNKGRFMPKYQPTCTLKPEYKTRTARVIAAIRHTANNFWVLLCNAYDRAWQWNHRRKYWQ